MGQSKINGDEHGRSKINDENHGWSQINGENSCKIPKKSSPRVLQSGTISCANVEFLVGIQGKGFRIKAVGNFHPEAFILQPEIL